MFKALFGRSVNNDLAHALYGAVVARSRDPRFYTEYGVPDTFDGRFEILVMHLFLVHDRLKDEDDESRKVSQRVFDAFIDDMDAALREAGVGDQTVPKRIAKMTKVFYGRTGAYTEALKETDVTGSMGNVIRRNLYAELDSHNAETELASYMVWQFADLQSKSASEITQQTTAFQGPLKERSFYAG